MTKHPEAVKRPTYASTNAEGLTWALGWREGLVTIWKGDADATLTGLAQKLGARLVGDDSEEYHADGTHTDWSEPRPILFQRPLGVSEAQTAWEMIFDRTFRVGGRAGLHGELRPTGGQ